MSENSPRFIIRPAKEEDCLLLLEFIRALARYEKLEHKVVATAEVLREQLFRDKRAEALIGEADGEAVAFAVFFRNFSTFLGCANFYLEDLFVKPEHRGKGYGKAMFARIAQIALERGGRRLDWWCLDWNEPSIAFYRRLGAVACDAWTVYRLEGESLAALAKSGGGGDFREEGSS